jgi:hypothetical protein
MTAANEMNDGALLYFWATRKALAPVPWRVSFLNPEEMHDNNPVVHRFSHVRTLNQDIFDVVFVYYS